MNFWPPNSSNNMNINMNVPPPNMPPPPPNFMTRPPDAFSNNGSLNQVNQQTFPNPPPAMPSFPPPGRQFSNPPPFYPPPMMHNQPPNQQWNNNFPPQPPSQWNTFDPRNQLGSFAGSGLSQGINVDPLMNNQGFISSEYENRTDFSFKSQRERDDQWIQNWLKQKKFVKGRTEKTGSDKDKILTIAETKNLLREALSLIQELKCVKKFLKETVELPDDTIWNVKLQRVLKIKSRVSEIQKQLFNENSMRKLVQKMTKIKKKRMWLKRKKEEKEAEDMAATLKREELHKEIDSWQRQIYHEDEIKQRGKQMKKEADSILSEVHRKQSEVRKSLELLKALQKLRQIRQQTAEQKGFYTTRESDIAFSEKIQELEKLLSFQLKDYESEERALKVMLETEQEAERQCKEEHHQTQIINAQKELVESLFTTIEAPNMTDLKYPFWQYYTQGERSLNSLLQIRGDWDFFLVPEGTPFSSSVPLLWVKPEEPSNSVWATFLHEK